jgi:hypothetical protein
MQAMAHDFTPSGADHIAAAPGERWALCVFAIARLLVQEMRTTQTDHDFGMLAEVDGLALRLSLAAAPAWGQLGCRRGHGREPAVNCCMRTTLPPAAVSR